MDQVNLGISLFNQNTGDILKTPDIKIGQPSSLGLTSGGGTSLNLIGLSRLNAINLLIAAGKDYLITYVENAGGADSSNNDTIKSQSNDTVVALEVYRYIAVTMVNVPNVVGLTEAQAITALSAVNLNYSGSTTTTGATSVNNGKIKTQSPASGTSVEENSTVSVVKYNYVVVANSINGNISGIRWAWQGDTSGNYAMFIRGRVFAGTVGSTVTIAGTSTGMDGNHTVVSINNDNSFDTGGTRIMITRDSAATGISSTVTGTWTLVS